MTYSSFDLIKGEYLKKKEFPITICRGNLETSKSEMKNNNCKQKKLTQVFLVKDPSKTLAGKLLREIIFYYDEQT